MQLPQGRKFHEAGRDDEECDFFLGQQSEDVVEEVLERPVKADAVERVDQVEGPGQLRERHALGVVDRYAVDAIEIQRGLQRREISAE